MPYLDQIVDKINLELVNSLNVPTLNGKFNGLSTVVNVLDQEVAKFPAIVDIYGNGESVFIDDKKNICTYHRVISKTISNYENNFGDGNDIKQMNVQMILCVWAKKSKLKKTNDQIEDMFLSGIKTQLETDFLKNYTGLNSVNININAINSDSLIVWNQEFENYKFNLKSDQHLFTVNYTVEIIYRQDCLSICINC